MTSQQHLTQLESTGLLRLAQTHPELEYLFRHALVQDAAYESLLLADRKALHRQVGETLERLYSDRLDELAAVLGRHFARTGDMEKAIDYLLLAGDRARGLYANEEAIEHCLQALSLLKKISPDDVQSVSKNKTQTRLYEGLGDVYELIGQHDEARAAYLNALSQVPKVNLIWQARLHRKTAYTFMMQRQDDAAMQAYKQAETTLGNQPAESNAEWWQEWIQIQLEWMEAYYWQAQPRQMATLADKVQPAIEQRGTVTQRTLFFNRLIQANFRQERYIVSDETLGYVEAMWAAAQESDNLGQRYSAQFTLGLSHLFLANFDTAEKHLIASLAAAERTGDNTHQARCLTYLTILFRKRDQIKKVRHYASRALEMASTLQMNEYIGTAKANLAWLAWREEKLVEAWEYGQTALEMWPGDYPFQWTALWPLIAVACLQNKLSAAIDYTRALLDPVQQRLPDVLTAELEEALLKWEEDQSEETRIHFDRAVKTARKLGFL